PHLRCRHIDVALTGPGSRAVDLLAQQLMAEAATPATGAAVAYRGGHRWVLRYEAAEPPAALADFRSDGAYVLTGGLGGVGMALARAIAESAPARLAFLGRSPLPAPAEWPRWLATHPEDDVTSQRLHRLQDLQALGAEVLYAQADVGDAAALDAALAQVRARFGPIRGVIHAAGSTAPETMRPLDGTDR